MEFYRDMFIYFFDVNHCGLDILDTMIEIDEDRALEYMMQKINEECGIMEIRSYCKNEKGMEKEEIDLCLQELKNGF